MLFSKPDLKIPLRGYANNFLVILLKEKPSKIEMQTMNIHNFGKSVEEIYELNKNLHGTLNKLLEFSLQIDTEQYGNDFSNTKDVRHVKRNKTRHDESHHEYNINELKVAEVHDHHHKHKHSNNVQTRSSRSYRSSRRGSVSNMTSSMIQGKAKAGKTSALNWDEYSSSSESDQSYNEERSLSQAQRKKMKNLLKENVSILKANETVKHVEKQLRHFYHKCLEQTAVANKMRYNYFKELVSLREMIYRKNK